MSIDSSRLHRDARESDDPYRERIGIPNQSVLNSTPIKQTPESHEETGSATPSGHEGESVVANADTPIGIPCQSVLNPKPLEQPSDGHEESVDDEIEEMPDEDSSSESSAFGGRILTTVLALGISGVVIILLSEISQFVQSVRSWPAPFQIPVYLAVLAFGGVFCWAMFQLGRAYRQLVVSPQVNLDLRLRETIRTQAKEQKKHDTAYKSLQSLVKDYPVNDRGQVRCLKDAGLKGDRMSDFEQGIRRLRDEDHNGVDQWISDCDSLFLKPLDRCADERIKFYARKVMIGTAVAPTGLLDSLIFSTNAILMVRDLFRLYNVRTSTWHSVLLTGQLAFSTFVTTELEDRLDEVSKGWFEELQGKASGMFETFGWSLARGTAKRVAEGGLNMMMLRRLGIAAKRKLRPIQLP